MEQTETVLTPAAAQLRLEEMAARFLGQVEREKRVVSHTSAFSEREGRYRLLLSYTCEESIGVYMESE